MTTLATRPVLPIGHSPVSSYENEQAIMWPEPKGITPALSALPDQANDGSSPKGVTPARVDEMRGHTFDVASLAETVTDIERARIAAENRHRSWVQSGAGGTAAEQQAAAIVGALTKVEHDATLALQRAVRRHPLGPFVKRTVGIGEKQGARLLAAIGDPWWNTLHDRPRTVSELWAYCGFHVLHPGHIAVDAHALSAGVDPSAYPGHARDDTHRGRAGVGDSAVTGHSSRDAHPVSTRDGDPSCSPPSQMNRVDQSWNAGVAARRRKGQKANWSNEAKMRARLCAESCIKQAHSPYRPVYDASRAADAGRGLTPLHEHNRALRKVAKALLKDLWREARDWHTAGDEQ